MRPLGGVLRAHLSDAHSAIPGVPHSKQVRVVRITHHIAVERDSALPRIQGKHQRIPGVFRRLVQGPVYVTLLIDDEVVQEQLFGCPYLKLGSLRHVLQLAFSCGFET